MAAMKRAARKGVWLPDQKPAVLDFVALKKKLW
jgi:hypothetical protein